MKKYLSLFLLFVSFFSFSQKFDKKISELISGYENQVIELRHWFHENAELSNREFKTSERIADELRNQRQSNALLDLGQQLLNPSSPASTMSTRTCSVRGTGTMKRVTCY